MGDARALSPIGGRQTRQGEHQQANYTKKMVVFRLRHEWHRVFSGTVASIFRFAVQPILAPRLSLGLEPSRTRDQPQWQERQNWDHSCAAVHPA